MLQTTRIGIDLAKNIFQLCAVDKHGAVITNKTVKRSEITKTLMKLPESEVVLEACASAHHWARVFSAQGHTVKIIHPQYVRPYVKTNKNDSADAEVLCEAASRPTMRFVQARTIEQQDMQVCHRVRQRMVSQRTALVNQTRGLLAEYGIVIPIGINQLRKQLPLILEDADNQLTFTTRSVFQSQYEELQELDQRVEVITSQINAMSEENPQCQLLKTVPGIGPLTATAMCAVMGDPQYYRNGREFSAFLGLVPRQHSTGGTPKLGHISKRGDPQLRSLLVMGAQSALYRMRDKQDRLSRWANRLRTQKGTNVAAVALANKLARICWAISIKKEAYRSIEV